MMTGAEYQAMRAANPCAPNPSNGPHAVDALLARRTVRRRIAADAPPSRRPPPVRAWRVEVSTGMGATLYVEHAPSGIDAQQRAETLARLLPKAVVTIRPGHPSTFATVGVE